jgi:hypothetical protein
MKAIKNKMEDILRKVTTSTEKWHFVWWNGAYAAAFPEKDAAVEYANHMCWPGDWEIVAKK